MKKLFLLFTVLTFGFTLSSCLDGNNNFTVPQEIIYIDNNTTEAYGISTTYGYIYSDRFNKLEPKHFYILGYSWEEEKGFRQIGELNAYNVIVTSEEKQIEKTTLDPYGTPTESGSKIEEIGIALYSEIGANFGDNWLFHYKYKGKEGEVPHVNFYKRETNIEKPNIIEIDIILTKTGTPKEGATEKELYNFGTVDMSHLRQSYLSGSTDEIEIKFYYNYDEEKDESTELKGSGSFKMKRPQGSNS